MLPPPPLAADDDDDEVDADFTECRAPTRRGGNLTFNSTPPAQVSQEGFDEETRKMVTLQTTSCYDSCMPKLVCVLVVLILALLLVWFIRR